MSLPTVESVKAEIADELVRVQRVSYGEATPSVDVALHDNFVTVIMDLTFSRSEQVLVDAGNGDLVKLSREAFQAAVSDTFLAVVEHATGQLVTSFSCSAVVDKGRPWAVEVFRLSGPPRVA
jgi:uncharacterized protein YbcI